MAAFVFGRLFSFQSGFHSLDWHTAVPALFRRFFRSAMAGSNRAVSGFRNNTQILPAISTAAIFA